MDVRLASEELMERASVSIFVSRKDRSAVFCFLELFANGEGGDLSRLSRTEDVAGAN